VVIQRASGHAGFTGKVVDRGRAKPVLAEQPPAGRNQRSSRLRDLFGPQRGWLLARWIRHLLLLWFKPMHTVLT
jgi:hypothetical protein